MSKAPGDEIVGLAAVSKSVVYPHIFANSDREVGGVLVGRQPSSGGMPLVTGAIEALSADEQRATLTFTQDAWEHVHRVLDTEYGEDEQIVGWYHSHPGFGIFLSGHDLFIHRNFFSGPSQIALVVDPLEGSEGVFVWRDGDIVQLFDRPTPGRKGLGTPDLQGSVPPPPAEHADELTSPGPARYRVATEAPRAPYPKLLLAGTGVLGLLLGLVIWTLVLGGSDTTQPANGAGTPAGQTTGGGAPHTQGEQTRSGAPAKVKTETTPASAKTPTTPASAKKNSTTTSEPTTTSPPASTSDDDFEIDTTKTTSTKCEGEGSGGTLTGCQ